MNGPSKVTVSLTADLNQTDETGYVWAFLGEAGEPDRVKPGLIIVAGDAQEPVLARVIDIVDGPSDERIVHLDVVGLPGELIEELRHSGLLPESAQRSG